MGKYSVNPSVECARESANHQSGLSDLNQRINQPPTTIRPAGQIVTPLPPLGKRSLYLLITELGLAVFGVYISSGFNSVAISVLLKEKGLSDALNSLNLSLYIMGYIAGCFLVIFLFRKLSSQKATLFVIVGILMSVLAFAFIKQTIFLIFWNFIQGVFAAAIAVIFSNIVTTISCFMKNKSFFIAIYVSVSSLAFFLGVESIGFLYKISHVSPFLLLTLFTGILSLPLIFSKGIHEAMEPGVEEHKASSVNLLSSMKSLVTIPVAFFSIIMYGLNNNIIGLIPIWELDQGYGLGNVAILITPLIMGGIILTSFFGSFSHYIGVTKTALIYTAILLSSIFIMHLRSFRNFSEIPLFLGMVESPILFISGGVINAFQSLYLCILSDRFKGAALTGACASASFLSHVVGVIVVPLGGLMMVKKGHHSLGVLILVINGVFVAFLLFQLWKQRKSSRNYSDQQAE